VRVIYKERARESESVCVCVCVRVYVCDVKRVCVCVVCVCVPLRFFDILTIGLVCCVCAASQKMRCTRCAHEHTSVKCLEREPGFIFIFMCVCVCVCVVCDVCVCGV